MFGIRPVRLFDLKLRTRSWSNFERLSPSRVPRRAEFSTTSFVSRPLIHSLTPTHVHGSDPCCHGSLLSWSIDAFSANSASASLFCANDGLKKMVMAIYSSRERERTRIGIRIRPIEMKVRKQRAFGLFYWAAQTMQ